jgi:hypothetical protein
MSKSTIMIYSRISVMDSKVSYAISDVRNVSHPSAVPRLTTALKIEKIG